MRILLLSQFYPPVMGGIERHVRSLGAALASRGHDVAVATLQQAGQAEQVESDGAVRVYRVRGTMQCIPALFTTERRHLPPFPDPGVTLALRGIVAATRPDVVHAHNWIVHSFLPIKRWSGAKLAVTLHDCSLVCAQMRMMYLDADLCTGPAAGKCLRCVAHHYGAMKGTVTLLGNTLFGGIERRLVDVFLPVSSAVADVSRLAAGRARFRVTPNFVPDDVAVAANGPDERLSALPSEFILQVGDITRDKGIGILLDAYAQLASPPPLVLIGRRMPDSPPTFPPGVVVIDGWPHASVMQAWRRSLFGVVPSTCLDACPTVTLEAMVSGRAVVASRIGGIVDQVRDDETGLLVPPGDVVSLRDAMARLIADPALRMRLGEAGRKRATEFQARSVVSRIEEVYRSL